MRGTFLSFNQDANRPESQRDATATAPRWPLSLALQDVTLSHAKGVPRVPRVKQGQAAPTVSGATLYRQVMALAAPVLVEQALLYLVGFSDTLLTGRFLQVHDLAAVTVGSYLTWFLGSLLIVASAGGTAVVSRLIGARDPDSANRLAQQSLVLGLVVGSALLAVGYPLMPHLVGILEMAGEASSSALIYLRIILLASPLLACKIVGIACLRGAGDSRTGMWVMILVNIINATLSWLLVVGAGPLPACGIAGIAAGTAVGEAAGGLAILYILARGRSGLKFHLNQLRPRPQDIRRVLRVSVPAAGESGANTLCQLVFLTMVNRLGDLATAAHGVAIRCEAVAFLTIAAFAVAASTLTGQYLGAGRPDLATRSVRISWALGTAVLTALGLLMFLFADEMFWLFLGGQRTDVLREGAPALQLIGIAMPFFATMTVLNGSLRGAGDTRVPMFIVLAGFLLIRLPVTYLLTLPVTSGGPGMGLYGAWIAMFVDILFRSALVTARFLSGRWQTVEV